MINMKIFQRALLIAFVLFPFISFSSNADDFSFDEAEFFSSFSVLDEIDEVIEQNPQLSYSELQNTEGLSIEAIEAFDFNNKFEPPLGIPSFAWGCVLGWVGILITYLVTDGDNEETKKALYGCLVAGGSYIVLVIAYYVFVIIFFASTATL
jgi:hypothetical protein